MKKNLNNIALGACLVFIFGISVYFIVQKINSESVNHYLDLLGGKLMAMIPEDNKKEEAAQLYDQFKQQVEEKKVAPEQVEKLAAQILNLDNLADSLHSHKVEKAMELALSLPVLAEPKISVIPENETTKSRILRPDDEKKWRQLGEHLKHLYIFENELEQKEKQKEIMNRRMFQYDSNLQVIVDSQLRSDLLRGADEALTKSIKELEKQKWLVWKDNYERDLTEKMKVLKMFQDSAVVMRMKQNRIKVFPGVEIIVPGPDSINVEIATPPEPTEVTEAPEQ